MTKYLIPRLRDILFISLLTTVILFGPRTFNLDGDIGRHITIGNYIVENASIPHTDIFSHTMTGQALTPHEWLAQVLFALTHRFLGLSGTVLVIALLIATTFTIVFHESQERSKALMISLAVTILAAAASSLHWLARPHVLTFLFLAIWSFLLDRVRCKENVPVWAFGLLMLFWANTHGAFIAGFATWGAYLAGELFDGWKSRQWSGNRLKVWGAIGLVSLVATFINPAGLHLWGTSIGFVSNSYLVSHTQEYLPPDFHIPGTWPFLLLIALSIFILGIKQKPLPGAHSLLLSGWAVMGLYSARNIPLFAIIASPILSEMVADNLGVSRWKTIEDNLLKIDRNLRGTIWIMLGVITAVFFMSTPVMRAYNNFDKAVFPVDAVNWLEENPQKGRAFNYFPWGGYLLYRQWPETLVFIDGQTDFYGEATTREYEKIIGTAQGWETILDKHQIQWAIIPSTSDLASALAVKGWEALYRDETAVILRSNIMP
jgi:MFS family permease